MKQLTTCQIPAILNVKPFVTTTPDAVISVVCDLHSLTLEQLKSTCRKTEIVYARHLCFYLLRRKTFMKWKNIGNLFNGMDHTSAMNGHRKIKDFIDINDEITLTALAAIEQKLRN